MPPVPSKLKQCTKCKQKLPVSQFYVNKLGKDGLNFTCKKCNAAAYQRRKKSISVKTLINDKVVSCQRGSLRCNRLPCITPVDDIVSRFTTKCEICGKECGNSINLDHDGKYTGEFRGFLCQLCNQALGKFEDDPELLHRAILYLKRSRVMATKIDGSDPPYGEYPEWVEPKEPEYLSGYGPILPKLKEAKRI